MELCLACLTCPELVAAIIVAGWPAREKLPEPHHHPSSASSACPLFLARGECACCQSTLSSPPFQQTAVPQTQLHRGSCSVLSHIAAAKHIAESHRDATPNTTPSYARRAHIVPNVLLITRITLDDLHLALLCRAAWHTPIRRLWWALEALRDR